MTAGEVGAWKSGHYWAAWSCLDLHIELDGAQALGPCLATLGAAAVCRQLGHPKPRWAILGTAINGRPMQWRCWLQRQPGLGIAVGLALGLGCLHGTHGLHGLHGLGVLDGLHGLHGLHGLDGLHGLHGLG